MQVTAIGKRALTSFLEAFGLHVLGLGAILSLDAIALLSFALGGRLLEMLVLLVDFLRAGKVGTDAVNLRCLALFEGLVDG